MNSSIPCPKCNEFDYHFSHSRNMRENIRKALLNQRPYRCHSCNYRGWVTLKMTLPKFSAKRTLFYLFILFVAVIVGYIAGHAIN